jgi:hypothetical protein
MHYKPQLTTRLSMAGSIRHARKLDELGVDAIVAQGSEAGGHVGDIATMVLHVVRRRAGTIRAVRPNPSVYSICAMVTPLHHPPAALNEHRFIELKYRLVALVEDVIAKYHNPAFRMRGLFFRQHLHFGANRIAGTHRGQKAPPVNPSLADLRVPANTFLTWPIPQPGLPHGRHATGRRTNTRRSC